LVNIKIKNIFAFFTMVSGVTKNERPRQDSYVMRTFP